MGYTKVFLRIHRSDRVDLSSKKSRGIFPIRALLFEAIDIFEEPNKTDPIKDRGYVWLCESDKVEYFIYGNELSRGSE